MTCLFPSRDLRVAPNARDMIVPASLRRDKSGLCDQECARGTGALRVVFYCHIGVLVLVVCAKTGEGGHDDAMLRLDCAEGDRLE
jgi:hypothetical protein